MPLLLLCVLPWAAGCASNDLNLLELETVRFKDENERIRQEDLLARYEKRKKQADALSARLLKLQHEREAAYTEYDALRGDLARVNREAATAEQERKKAETALAVARAETARLAAELKKEREEIRKLNAELEKLAARIRALEAKKSNTSTPEE